MIFCTHTKVEPGEAVKGRADSAGRGIEGVSVCGGMGSTGDGVVAGDLDFLVYFRSGLGPVGAGPADCFRVSVAVTVRACWVVVGSLVRS